MDEIIKNYIDANSELFLLGLAGIFQFLLLKFYLIFIKKSVYSRAFDIQAKINVIVMMFNQTFMVCVSAWCVMDDVTSGTAWLSLFFSFLFMVVSSLKINSNLYLLILENELIKDTLERMENETEDGSLE